MGRRSGKTRAVAALAVYLATCIDYRHILAPGETGELLLIAQTVTRANKLREYLLGMFCSIDWLRPLGAHITATSILLKTGVEIFTLPASFKSVRGGTSVAVILDEVAFWNIDETSRNPDTEIVHALRPSLATTGGPLIGISSPYARRGVLWQRYSTYFKPDAPPDILVAQAASSRMNATLDRSVIERDYELDPAVAAAEWGGLFRSDIESFIDLEVLEPCIDRHVHERAPIVGTAYFGFVDPSGGMGDSFTLAIAHAEDESVVLDLVREVKPKLSPEAVCKAYAEDLNRYGLHSATSDHYAGEWPIEAFDKHGIKITQSADPKSVLYGRLLPLLNSGKARLLDNSRLINQLVGLERRTARSGRDSIDHIPGGHDDVANAVAGALALVDIANATGTWGGTVRRDGKVMPFAEAYALGVDELYRDYFARRMQ